MRRKWLRRTGDLLLHFTIFYYKLLFIVLCFGNSRWYATEAVILSGGANSFARYPKWAQTFENQLNFEFKTKVGDAILLYTDDGAIHSNFYAISIVDGRLQLDFRLGDESQDDLVKRPVMQIRVQDVAVNDNRWHKFVLFQAWENVKVQVDDTVVFKILNQRSFAFGNLRTNSDVFVGGLPKDLHHLSAMSSPLRRHSKHFAGSIKNLVYRLYPQGVSSPQLIDSNGTRQTDDEYCSNKLTYSSSASIESNDPSTTSLLQYCKNNGRCYSSNTGPKCDCSFTDYEGRQCDTKKKTSAELSFFANEWLGYDLISSKNGASTSSTLLAGGAGVWSRRENLTLVFKTSSPNGLLFVGGDHQNYVQLMLERGVLLAVCKLEGSEKRIIRVFNKSLKPARYDDDVWHSVMLYRDLSLPRTKYSTLTMRLTVDGSSDEVKQLATNVEWLGNSFAFVGGAPHGRLYIPNHLFQFKGCMKKVKFEADAIQLDLIELADQGYGNSVVRTSGDLSFSCSNPSNVPDILSFNSGQHFITLPTWNSLSSGSLGFQLRSSELDGLILYHGLKTFQNQSTSDFIAFELIDGHLYLIVNLGSGHVRLQTTSKRVNDGNWHTVAMERVGRTGSVAVDNVKTVFSTPGVSANLIINDEPIYVGAAPWTPLSKPKESVWNTSLSTSSRKFPSAVWTTQLRKGLVGCLKNLRINGINAQIATQISSALETHTDQYQLNSSVSTELGDRGITIGCAPTSPDVASQMYYCNSLKSSEKPCHNFGKCLQGLNTFKCDCSNTLYEGPTCSIKPQIVSYPLAMPSSLQYTSFSPSSPNQPQLAVIEEFPPIFRLPNGAHGVLFDTKAPYAPNKRDRILLLLVNGELELKLVIGNASKHTFNWGTSLNDNQWHMVQIKRRGEKLLLFLDGKWQNNYFLPDSSNVGIYIEEISVGRALSEIDSKAGSKLSDESQERSSFDGDILSLHFNGYDVLESTRHLVSAYSNLDESTTTTDHTTSIASKKHNKSHSNTVSFENTKGYAQLLARRVEQAQGFYRISFKLKTLASSGLLFLMLDEQGTSPEKEFTAVELYQQRLKYTTGYWSRGAGRHTFHVEHTISPLWFEDPSTSSLKKPVEPLDDLRWHTVNIQQDTLTGSHHIWINNFTMSLRPTSPYIAAIKGNVFLGGIPQNYTLIPASLSRTSGYRGCLSNLKLGKDHLDIWSDSHLYTGMHKGCSGPSMRCSPTACKHKGICHQGWKGIKCDCSMTTYSGPFCEQMGTSYSFNALGTSIYYEYASIGESTSSGVVHPPSSSDDELVLAFSSHHSNGVLLSVQCSVEDDYLTLFLGGGYLQVKYNLGSREHHLGYFDVFVNDGRRHVVRMSRKHANMTLSLDTNMPIKYVPSDPSELFTLNSYWRITVGGSFNLLHNLPQVGLEPSKMLRRSPIPMARQLTKVYDEFNGNISGVNFNGLRILDLFARGHSRTFSTGQPKLLHMAVFDSESDDPNEFVKLHSSYSSPQNLPDLNRGAEAARPSSSSSPTNYSAQLENSSDSFFDNTPLGCLPFEATSDCERTEETVLDEEQLSAKDFFRIFFLMTAICGSVNSIRPPRDTHPANLQTKTPQSEPFCCLAMSWKLEIYSPTSEILDKPTGSSKAN
uniref:Neurexin n=1 Tax=Ditylenchus dipsaci TaxID=166011 RepID=A0A915D4Y4_9BILA